MNQYDFSFETPAWKQVLDALRPSGSFCAAKFLTLMESEPDEAMEEALQTLEARDVLLDISQLPEDFGTGDSAVRLRREQQLVRAGNLFSSLEENDPLRLNLQEIAQTPTCGDPQPLAEQFLNGDQSVAKDLTNGMLDRVVEHALFYVGKGVLLLDLIQEGSLALWQGILEYSGGNFRGYCDRRICRALARAVVLQARANGIGRKLRQSLEDFQAVDNRLLTELGRNPTLEEVAQALSITLQEASFLDGMLSSARMMANTAQPETQETPDNDQAVENTAYFQMRQRIQELLSVLPEADVKLLTLRFGLEGGMAMSPEQAGKLLGLTPEEVLAAEAKALSQLRTNR